VCLKFVALLAFAVGCAHGQTEVPHYSLLDNLNEKLSHENLDDRVVLGKPAKKYVPIVAGAEFLLKHLESAPEFKKDRIWSRLAYTRPFSTIAFREKDNPSTHVVFVRLPDGSLKADMHLDGNGPQKLFPHLDEFIFHKLTFKNNNQDRMNANLKRQFIRDQKGPQQLPITQRERTLLYVHETLGFQPIVSAVSSSMFRHYIHEVAGKTQRRYEPTLNSLAGSLARHVIRNSIEFGVASWRQEDTRYKPSGEQGAMRRLRYAIVQVFVVPTPTGREFAYARFAGIVGTMAISDAWHPWRERTYAPNYARRATLGLFLDPVLRSMLTEFGPDLKRVFHLHK